MKFYKKIFKKYLQIVFKDDILSMLKYRCPLRAKEKIMKIQILISILAGLLILAFSVGVLIVAL